MTRKTLKAHSHTSNPHSVSPVVKKLRTLCSVRMIGPQLHSIHRPGCMISYGPVALSSREQRFRSSFNTGDRLCGSTVSEWNSRFFWSSRTNTPSYVPCSYMPTTPLYKRNDNPQTPGKYSIIFGSFPSKLDQITQAKF